MTFSLATLQIRRELLDLARHYFGPQGTGANHASHGRDSEAGPLDRADSAAEPSKQAEWCEFHRIIDTLPQEERDVVGLLYYHGMAQAEAAEILGVTVRTVQLAAGIPPCSNSTRSSSPRDVESIFFFL